MAEAASAHQAASASREESSEQRAGRRRRSSADPQRAQQGATAAAAAAPAARDSLSRLQLLADASPQVAQLRRLQALADGHYAPVAQLAGAPEEKELVQGQFASAELPPQRQQAPRANNTSLPDQLKSGIESLSSLSMDHVRVHYNSAQPEQLNALAYAQGSDIHLAPGQERHLPHEAWHVVQQAQGRVRPTLQLKDGVQVNDDAGLEREADVMGSKALEGGHRAVETHRSISMPIDTAQRIEGDALNSPEAIVANNHSAPLANGQGSAQRGGNEMQRIAYQCAQAALQRQVQAWGDGSDRVEELRVWQRVADGRGVGGKSQDLTPGFTAQRQAQEHGGHLSTQLASSPRQLAQRRLIGQMLGSTVQRVEGELDEEEGGAAQLRAEPVQREAGGLGEEEEPPAAAQLRAEPAQRQENRTGMPDGLKAGIESLSGMNMSGVRVHRNSSQPAQLNALAYAQGNDIHLGPGQEQHLPHEAWHVVQQRQGRVQATMQMAGVGVNDDVGLEREADVMGGRAVGLMGGERQDLTPNLLQRQRVLRAFGQPQATPSGPVVQGKDFDFHGALVQPENEESFTALVERIITGADPEIVLAALHEALMANVSEDAPQAHDDATEYVRHEMAARLKRPMHAPPTLTVAHLTGVFDELWEQTVTTGLEQGGILTEARDTGQTLFKQGEPGQSGSNFTVNRQDWDREAEDLAGVVHTHPSGTPFSGTDLAAQFSSRARVEYVRTNERIFAIIRSGDFENRMRARIAELGGAAEVQQKIAEDFDANFEVAMKSFMETQAIPKGEAEREAYIDRCQEFAVQHAVRLYATWMNTGYYEGPADGSEPLKRKF